VLRRLGALSVERFMRDYWQRHPVLLPATLPGFESPISREQLFAWAREPEVDTRLITNMAGWHVRHGPIARLPSPRRPGWTLLVQGVDLLDDAARSFLSRFRFLPDARLDDLMISYASDGVGVGPHVDSYDVFLLQARGRRRWRISRQADLDLRPGLPLRVLANFRSEQEWVLESGDMLYLPPGVAHEGTAVGTDCMTFSIGFRAPALGELLEPWVSDFAEHAALDGRYADPGAGATCRPARLPASMTARMHRQLTRARPGIRDTERFLLSRLSEPKPQVVFEPPRKPLAPAAFARAAARRGVELDRRSRLLYSSRGLSINGEWQPRARSGTASLLFRLGDERALRAQALTRADAATFGLLHAWYRAGWIRLGSPS